MELKTNDVPKRKRRKTRKCLDQIRQKSRKDFEDVTKKSSKCTNKKACVSQLKNSKVSNSITNNRLTLKMIPKVVCSETVARLPSIDPAFQQLKSSLNKHEENDGQVNKSGDFNNTVNAVQSKKVNKILASNSDTCVHSNYENVFISDHNSRLECISSDDNEVSQTDVDSENYYNNYKEYSHFIMNDLPTYIENNIPQLQASNILLKNTSLYHKEPVLQVEPNTTSLKEILQDVTITTNIQSAKSNTEYIDGSTSSSCGFPLECLTPSSVSTINTDVISMSSVSVTSHHNVPVTPDFIYYPHILK